jgi:hypothetical protein
VENLYPIAVQFVDDAFEESVTGLFSISSETTIAKKPSCRFRIY